jgi:hypothetical protein
VATNAGAVLHGPPEIQPLRAERQRREHVAAAAQAEEHEAREGGDRARRQVHRPAAAVRQDERERVAGDERSRAQAEQRKHHQLLHAPRT